MKVTPVIASIKGDIETIKLLINNALLDVDISEIFEVCNDDSSLESSF